MCYIYSKQLEEADIIALNKVDSLSESERAELIAALKKHFPHAKVFAVSALTGAGLEEWLEFVQRDIEAPAMAGRQIAEVDYDVYAEGEAELGWLNASVTLASDSGVDWKRFCLDLLKNFRTRLRENKVEAAHVKLALNASGGGAGGEF